MRSPKRRFRLARSARVMLVGMLLAPAGMARGSKWGPPTIGTGAEITWSLMPTGASSGDSASIVALADFMPTGFKDQLIQAMDTWAQAANVTFVEVPDNGIDGAMIRIGGHAFDGVGGTAAHAYYPGSWPGAGDIHFDTGENWVTTGTGLSQGGTQQDLYSVMLHELGHAVMDMGHTAGAISVVNAPPTSTAFTRELMPYDIASAQYLYGVKPGYQAPAPANGTFNLDSTSFFQMTVSAFEGQVSLTATGTLGGALDARIEHDAAGDPVRFALRDADLKVGDLSGSVSTPLLSVVASILGGDGWLYSTHDQVVDPDGNFDLGGTLVGLVGGNFNIEATILGTPASGRINLFYGPVSIGVQEGDSTGTLIETDTLVPGVKAASLLLPMTASVVLDASLFLDNINPGDLPVTVTVNTLISASGTVIVPECSSLVLAGLVGAAAAIGRQVRRKRGTAA